MNVIITGARTGIGRATLEKFASQGANIWACAHCYNEDFEHDMSILQEQYNVSIKPVYFDLKKEDEIKKAMKEIIAEKRKIDVLINNAGMPYGALLLMTSMKDLRDVFEVNFFSQVLITQIVAKIMTRQKSGCIVNLSSVAGLDGDAGYTAYGSSKAAISFFTKVISEELAKDGIRVNAVAPGLIETKMMDCMEKNAKKHMLESADMKRFGRPEEVANVIYYLASEDASFITGQTLRVDGGL